MAHTHEFDCRICGAHLDSQQELDKHNHDKHAAQSASGSSSSNQPSSNSDSQRNRQS